MNTYTLAQQLSKKYKPDNIDINAYLLREEYLSSSIIPSDILVYSGKGATLQTNRGLLYDFASMTVNCILGQNDPWVNANLIAYLLSERPSFLTTRLGSDYYYKVAQRILSLTNFDKGVINHRQCNGTDVNEIAILAAYYHKSSDKNTLVSFKNSYHGQGLTAYLMSGLQRQHQFLINDSPVIFLDEPSHTENIDMNEKITERDSNTLSELKKIASKVFAVIIEPIQINNAVNTPSKKFMKELKNICVKNDIALIFDEVQTGFGWLGTITAAQRYEVQPNLMALSKALTAGNGPFAALVSDKKYQYIPDGTASKTNGADIRSLIAASAVMDRLTGIPKDDIPHNLPDQLAQELYSGLITVVPQKGDDLMKRLQNLKEKSNGLIGRIKGDRLVRGVEILDSKGNSDPIATKKLQFELMQNGILVRHYQYTLIFKPPVTISNNELDKGFAIIEKIIKKYV